MNNKKLFNELLKADGIDPTGPNASERTAFARLLDQQSKTKHSKLGSAKLNIWRVIMNSKITKYAVAAMVMIALGLSITLFDKTMPAAYATEILQEAIDAVSDLWSVQMKAKMRTRPNDNFANIGLDYDFVDINMWMRGNTNGHYQWRVEKPGRSHPLRSPIHDRLNHRTHSCPDHAAKSMMFRHSAVAIALRSSFQPIPGSGQDNNYW